MAVRLLKKSGSLDGCARKFILCAKVFVHCAEIFSPRNIYISGAPKHLCERANNLACAEILNLCAET